MNPDGQISFFPAVFRLSGQRVVIAGGGELATRKARLVAGAGVDLCFVAPVFAPAIREEWSQRASFIERAPETADFAEAVLAFVAEEDDAIAEDYAQIARRSGVPLNVVDRPELSDFQTPSIVRRGEVTIAISTGGAAPVLGKLLRERIEAMLPARLGELAAMARAFRPAVAAKIAPAMRRRFWERVFRGDIAERFLGGDVSGAREATIASINSADDARRGVVHIVGAGPGDPELLTLKALRLIQMADVIVHDRLVGKAILELARRDAERFYVGKEKSNHSVSQRQIEAMLIREAKAGKIVVRLKGGDPFIFGRGGEELDRVRAAGIPAFVTPGITAATGGAASVGLPLTHRDYAQAVTLVTGHGQGDGDPDLDWQALAALGQTLVIYMGVSNAGTIAANLIAHGRAGDTPAAIIENATRTDEKIIRGSLRDLQFMVENGNVTGPALLVVGEVVQRANGGELLAPLQERLTA